MHEVVWWCNVWGRTGDEAGRRNQGAKEWVERSVWPDTGAQSGDKRAEATQCIAGAEKVGIAGARGRVMGMDRRVADVRIRSMRSTKCGGEVG